MWGVVSFTFRDVGLVSDVMSLLFIFGGSRLLGIEL